MNKYLLGTYFFKQTLHINYIQLFIYKCHLYRIIASNIMIIHCRVLIYSILVEMGIERVFHMGTFHIKDTHRTLTEHLQNTYRTLT